MTFYSTSRTGTIISTYGRGLTSNTHVQQLRVQRHCMGVVAVLLEHTGVYQSISEQRGIKKYILCYGDGRVTVEQCSNLSVCPEADRLITKPSVVHRVTVRQADHKAQRGTQSHSKHVSAVSCQLLCYVHTLMDWLHAAPKTKDTQRVTVKIWEEQDCVAQLVENRGLGFDSCWGQPYKNGYVVLNNKMSAKGHLCNHKCFQLVSSPSKCLGV